MSNNTVMEENLVGKVATCGKNIVGVIQGKKELPWGMSWVGERLDDGGEWASKHPKIIADSIDEYNNQLLHEFGFEDEDE